MIKEFGQQIWVAEKVSINDMNIVHVINVFKRCLKNENKDLLNLYVRRLRARRQLTALSR